ncbi:MAG: SWIM zinc finger family protein [Acidobacteria bacterium]|nr:SWIM zinc finger family protein [Acidobacteriota bacterium]
MSVREIRQLAGERFFARGEKYFDEGRVHGLTEYRGQVAAKVAGTEDYRVKFWAERGRLGYSCSCPVGDDGEFCKHCVAAALAWIEESGGKGKRGKPKKSAAMMEDVRAFLEQQDKGKLVEMLLNEALESDSLRERLFLETARMNPERIDLATYRRSIKNATRANDYVDYYSAGGYARGVHRVIESVAALLDDGHVVAVIELTEYALSQIEKSLEYIDDSDGHMGGCINELQELHHRACLKANPDVVALAQRLFEWEMRSEWEIFGGVVVSYPDVLGESGLTEYRRLAEAEWARVPALGPGEDDSESYLGAVHGISPPRKLSEATSTCAQSRTLIIDAVARAGAHLHTRDDCGTQKAEGSSENLLALAGGRSLGTRAHLSVGEAIRRGMAGGFGGRLRKRPVDEARRRARAGSPARRSLHLQGTHRPSGGDDKQRRLRTGSRILAQDSQAARPTGARS